MRSETTIEGQDPRSSLARWANRSDEWIRRIVRQILGSKGTVSESDRAQIFRLFLEEKGFESRTLPSEPPLQYSAQDLGASEPLHLVQLSDVKGVNALAEAGQIKFAPGLTLLFGENGTGKTGYSRILKTMAGSRSADDILPNVNLEGNPPPPSAEISYRLGDSEVKHQWNDERGQPPFDRMSIFDNPAVHFHVDSDLGYTYSPAALAIFDRVRAEVQHLGTAIEAELGKPNPSKSALLGRFDSRSTIYPYVQSLGAATNLTELRPLAELPDDAEDQKQALETTIARLRANAVGQELSAKSGFQRALTEGIAFASLVANLEVQNYNDALSRLSDLRSDQERLRVSLFAAADLPADPDPTWETFIRSGNDYRLHLESVGAHDNTRCLYCGQILSGEALELISKYGDYLENQIANDIRDQETVIRRLAEPVQSTSLAMARAYIESLDSESDLEPQLGDNQIEALRTIVDLDDSLRNRCADGSLIDGNIPATASSINTWLSILAGRDQ